MNYYKTIAGKKMDARMIEKAVELVCGKGDGRLSLSDAGQLLKLAKDGNVVTPVERDTNRLPVQDISLDYQCSQLV